MALPGYTAEASLYQTKEKYQLRNVTAGRVESSTAIYPAAAFRGCYGLYYDCDINGFYGVMNGWWSWYICDNRYCSNGFGLVTER